MIEEDNNIKGSEIDKPDLWLKLICINCKQYFFVSGSAAVNLIKCPHCNSKNFDHVRK